MAGEIISTVCRSIVSILVLFLFARLMGKKQISQLSLFDYVSGISIGSIAAEFAVNQSIPYADGITAIVIYGLFPVAFSLISLKSYLLHKLLDGKPVIVIQNGKIIEENLRKTRLNINDLLEECRLKGVFNVEEVEYGIFETNGKLSILKNAALQPLTPTDMGMQPKNKGICTNLIVDKNILCDNLQLLNIDREWLQNELNQNFSAEPSGILLCVIDSSGKLSVDRKNADPPVTPLM
jgi:uncharacterized membrane protein YcaP (DUF421 family)